MSQHGSPARGAARGAPSTWPAALAGVVAGVLGLGVAEIAAGLVDPSSAPLVALSGGVVDAVPAGLKDLAISLFGTQDKLVLRCGAVLVALLLSALAGWLAGRGSRAGTWLVLALAALGGLAAAARPDSATLAVVPSALGGLAGMVTLQRLVRPQPAPPSAGDGTGQPRRTVITVAPVLVAGLVAVAAGRLIGRRLGSVDASREAVRSRLPHAADPPPPLPAGVEVGVRDVVPFRVPNDDFYRIDTALVLPRVAAEDWQLRIHGLVAREVTVDFDELVAGRLIERDVTLACVSNPVGGDLVGNARWLGLPIGPLLARAGPRPDADMVLSTSSDGWTCSTPLAALTDGRDAMLAVAMNGEPLPVAHGFPVRMVVPGLYGYVSATKWVVDLEVTRFDSATAYWTPRGWSARAPVKTASRIDVPRQGATVQAGPVAVAGVAWAQQRGIRAVEVRVDDGPWEPAHLGAEVSIDTWRQWAYRWQPAPGRYLLGVRATDGSGRLQTGASAPPAPDGATGWHTVDVQVD